MTKLAPSVVAAVAKSCRDKSKTCRSIALEHGCSPASVVRISYAHGISRWRPVQTCQPTKRNRVGYDEVGSVMDWRRASARFWSRRGLTELAKAW